MSTDSVTTFVIRARRSISVLPRCLQVLSRRGCTLVELRTDPGSGDSVTMYCTISGPIRWQPLLGALLMRVVDVYDVKQINRNQA